MSSNHGHEQQFWRDLAFFFSSVVWKELEKENKEFFEAYSRTREERMSEMETREMILKLLAESSREDTDD